MADGSSDDYVSGTISCTGSLIGPDTVLTSAHCIYSLSTRSFYSNITFAPGRHRKDVATNGSITELLIDDPEGTWQFKHVTILKSYISSSSESQFDHDLALVRLVRKMKRPKLGLKTGWLGLSSLCSEGGNESLTSYGYPLEWSNESSMCVTSNCSVSYSSLNSCDQRRLFNRCSATEGESGSPVIDLDSYRIKALMSGQAYISVNGSTPDVFNIGTRILPDVLTVFKSLLLQP